MIITDKTVTTETFSVRADRLEGLKKTLVKLAKRAERNGCTVPTWSVGPLQTEDFIANKKPAKRYFHEVTLTSAPIALVAPDRTGGTEDTIKKFLKKFNDNDEFLKLI